MAFDDLQRARLQWMFDNQPEWVKELLDKGKLEVLDQSILNSVITAINMENKLQEKGMNYAQAHDFAVESLTPADGPYFTDPQPPPPLSQEDQARVRAALEAREEARDRIVEREKKRRKKQPRQQKQP